MEEKSSFKIVGRALFSRTRSWLFIAGLPVALHAAPEVGVHATQAVLHYMAPDNNPCTIEVSEFSTFRPLVNDVNPVLFPGADQDSRAGSVVTGTNRLVVIGRRAAEKGADGNYYSRALQTDTPHYYRITCGSSVGTGSFHTATIPLGNTFNDPLPVDPAYPGTYAYPTLSDTDRTQTVIDPQTGVLIRRVTVKKYSLNWPAAHKDLCSQSTITDSAGNTGYYCVFQGNLFFINSLSGESRVLGSLENRSLFYGQCDPLGAFDPTNPRAFYCGAYDATDRTTAVLVRGEYTGDNSAGVLFVPNTAAQYSVITPKAGGHDVLALAQAFEPELAGFTPVWAMGFLGMQDGYLFFQTLRGDQDTYGWVIRVDPGNNLPIGSGGTGGVVGVLSSYRHAPTRWCSIHYTSTIPSGQYNGWLGVNHNDLNSAGVGGGPYQSHLVSGLLTSALTTCPPNAFGVTGDQCSAVTVDGEPLDPTPVGGEPAYLQDAAAGDYFRVDSETMRLIVKNPGNSWVFQRAWGVAPHSGTTLMAGCGVADLSGKGISWTTIWDTVNDPHGKNPSGTTMISNLVFPGTHGDYRTNTEVNASYTIFSGAYPEITQAAPSFTIDGFPAFNGLKGVSYDGFVNSHPMILPLTPWFLDGRPYSGDNTGGAGTLVSGQLYKFGSQAYGGKGTQLLSLHPDIVPTMASCGDRVLKDVSGPQTLQTPMSTDASGNYTYCIAKVAGECSPGSAVGDTLVNCPGVTQASCIQGGGQYAQYASLTSVDICLADVGAYTNDLTQMSAVSPYSNGEYGRILSRNFNIYRREPVFFSSIPLPGGRWSFLYSETAGTPYNDDITKFTPGQGQIFLAKLPSWPGPDALKRNSYVPIPLTLTPTDPTVTNALVEFGYAENGPPTLYACTSRQEACVVSSTTTTPSRPFNFFQTDAISGIPCKGGCTATLPLIPQRTAFFQILFRNAGGQSVEQVRGVAGEWGATTSVASAPGLGNVSVVATDSSQVRVYPNPWRSDVDQGVPIIFDHLTVDSRIRMFTVSGHLVKKLDAPIFNGSQYQVTWNGTNDSGQPLASGIYLYLVTNDQGQKIRGKFAIIR